MRCEMKQTQTAGWYSTVSDFASRQLALLKADVVPDRSSSHRDGILDHEIDNPINNVANIPLVSAGLRQGGLGSSPLTTSGIERIYTAFDVSQPVAHADDLRGRDVEVGTLLSGVLFRRTHGIIAGPRGSGKTSLVRVFGQYADREGIVVLYSACDDETTFGDLLRSYLDQVPASSLDADDVETFRKRIESFDSDSTPHHATAMLAMLKYSRLIIILDEFDRITSPELQSKISSLLKLVSDARIPVRFVLVGGESAFIDIVKCHASLMRHVTRVSTFPLQSEAVFELLDRCADRCDLDFTDASKLLINEAACGSPYHTRLFGMHAALAAHNGDAVHIDPDHVISGFERAFEEWALLNEEVAATFREISDGRHGNPDTFVEFAERMARGGNGADAPAHAYAGNGSAGAADVAPALMTVFGSALTVADGPIAFRDATAPQYLIALHKTRRRNHRSKG